MKQPLIATARLLAAALLTVTIWVATTAFVSLLAGPDGISSIDGMGVTPPAALLLLFTFIGMLGGTLFAARLLYNWTFLDLFGPLALARKLAPRALIVCGIATLFTVVLALMTEDLPRQLSIGLWLGFLPAAIVALAVQTLSEEMVFRAFLPKALNRIGLTTLWSVLISSLLFTLLHTDTEATTSRLIGGYVIIFALALALSDLTQKSGSLVSAWILHFSNNFSAALLFAPKGKVSGLSLYVTSPEAATEVSIIAILIELAMIFAIWFFIRRGMRNLG